LNLESRQKAICSDSRNALLLSLTITSKTRRYGQPNRVNLWFFYDEKGNRVWVRLERVLRVHFQHDQKVPQKEMVRLIYNGLRWVVGAAREKQFNEVIFESRAPRLIQFCKKLFGFKSVEGNYSLCVAPADNRSN